MMNAEWIAILLPFLLVLARVSGFFAVLPLFSWEMLPMRIRAAIALLITIFFAFIIPAPALASEQFHWLAASLLVMREALCGVALGLIARLIFSTVQQGIAMGTQQMGFADAGIIDPDSGESDQAVVMIFQMLFAVLFLGVGGHHLLLLAIGQSYRAFPIGQTPEPAVLAESLVTAGAMMLVFALKLAAPLLAGFLLLSVILGVIARVMPEMNILMASFPLRVGLGIFLSILVLRTLGAFTAELADWLNEFLAML
ncbi:MAG: flagellar biosynthetic protein FliR [Phycisphaerae bacterium]|nr:flagellar biosynthetic protein FliR [Phycisphaerae bacterium]